MNLAFDKWFYSAPHRTKYTRDHPAYLGAQEAWDSATVGVAQLDSALNTLRRMGYTWHGGEEWKPPLGPRPKFTATWLRRHQDIWRREYLNDELLQPSKVWQAEPIRDPGCSFYVSVDPTMAPDEMVIATIKREPPNGFFVMSVMRCVNLTTGRADECDAWFELPPAPKPPAKPSNVLTVAPLLQRGPFGAIS